MMGSQAEVATTGTALPNSSPPPFFLIPWVSNITLQWCCHPLNEDAGRNKEKSAIIDVSKMKDKNRPFPFPDSYRDKADQDEWTTTVIESASASSSHDSWKQQTVPVAARAIHPSRSVGGVGSGCDENPRDVLLLAEYRFAPTSTVTTTTASTNQLPVAGDVLFYDAQSELPKSDTDDEIPDVSTTYNTALTRPLIFAATVATRFTMELWHSVVTVVYFNVLLQLFNPSAKSTQHPLSVESAPSPLSLPTKPQPSNRSPIVECDADNRRTHLGE